MTTVKEAFAKAGIKPSSHSYAHEKWKKQEKLRFDELALKLKRRRRNPFVMGPAVKSGLKCYAHGFLGAAGAVAINRLFTDTLPAKWHMPTHAALAAGSLFLPLPGFGGAMFYALISETYYSIIRKQILESAKTT